MKAAGPLQKLLHLANAREALASGDLQQAMNEADAAVDADPGFAAGRALRAEIVARMNGGDVVEQEPVVIQATAPALVPPIAVASIRTPSLAPPSAATGLELPISIPKAHPQRRRRGTSSTGLAVALGILVIAGGIGIVVLTSGIMAREHVGTKPLPAAVMKSVPPAATKPVPTAAKATPTPVLPATPRPAADQPLVARVEKPAEGVSPPVVSPAATLPPAGPALEWASPRLTQLSVRPRWRASAMDVDDAALLKDLGEGISELWVGKLMSNEDAIFVGGTIGADVWMQLRSSLKPSGVVWRIFRNRSAPGDITSSTNAVAAGFSLVKKVRYSSDYAGEQFALRAARQ